MKSYNFTNREHFRFPHLILISIAIHLVFFFFYTPSKVKIPKPEIIEVEFQTIQVERPINKPAASKPVPQKPVKPKPAQEKKPEKITLPQPKPKIVEKKQPPSKPTPSKPATPVEKPVFNLKANSPSDVAQKETAKLTNQASIESQKRFQQKTEKTNPIEDLNKLSNRSVDPKKLSSTNPLSEQESSFRENLALPKKPTQNLKPINPSILNKPSTQKQNRVQNENFDGTLQYRKIIFKPPPPSIHISDNTSISLQIVVKPNGEVSQVFPLKKGNAELEKIGMDYVAKYRFEPSPGRKSQTGIIHLTVKRGKIQ